MQAKKHPHTLREASETTKTNNNVCANPARGTGLGLFISAELIAVQVVKHLEVHVAETIKLSHRGSPSLLLTHSHIRNPLQVVQPSEQNPICRAMDSRTLTPAMLSVQGFVSVLFPASS